MPVKAYQPVEVGDTLHEATEIDTRHARFINTDLGEHLVPVNANVPSGYRKFMETTG